MRILIYWGKPEQAPPSVAAGQNVCLSVLYVMP